MKDIVKIDPLETIVVDGHSMLSGVNMGTLTVRVTDTQDFLHDMLLPAMNVPGLGLHLISGGMVALKAINTVIAKKSHHDVDQFKISLRTDIDCPTIYYLDIELAPSSKRKQRSRRGSF